MNTFEGMPETMESEAEQESGLERFREVLQKIDSVENLRHTRELMAEVAAGRVDPEDPQVLAALDERIRELEA